MRRALTESLSLAVVGGALVVLVAVVSPGRRSLALDLYVLFAGALALLALARVARAAESARASSFDEALAGDAPAIQRPVELERLERVVVLGIASSFDFHYRLRPILREIADHRLRRRLGTGLDDGSADARQALGERGWELLRLDRGEPADRQARGVRLGELERMVSDLEGI